MKKSYYSLILLAVCLAPTMLHAIRKKSRFIRNETATPIQVTIYYNIQTAQGSITENSVQKVVEDNDTEKFVLEFPARENAWLGVSRVTITPLEPAPTTQALVTSEEVSTTCIGDNCMTPKTSSTQTFSGDALFTDNVATISINESTGEYIVTPGS